MKRGDKYPLRTMGKSLVSQFYRNNWVVILTLKQLLLNSLHTMSKKRRHTNCQSMLY